MPTLRPTLLALAVTLIGGGLPAQATPAAAKLHTAADVRFMQGMIAHHAQAVAMVALVPARTERRDLRILAGRIDVSQQDEIRSMQAWLKDRGEPAPAADAHHGGHDERMPGMLSPDQMAALERARGVEFERLFLAGMIQHHEGALTMVAELLATPGAGQESEIFRFASDVDADQRAEIARMRRLLQATPTP